jgi:hypothetical protein
MDVVAATSDYEAWLGKFCQLHMPDLAYKHSQMSSANDPFPFFRGTYYRWVELWKANCPKLLDAPRPLAIGDLHVENFGTWRDADGRLCWGINDFDEADELPYTNDLVRLATSVRFARKSGILDIKFGAACRTILDGYRKCLTAGGQPFVCEERNPELRAMANAAEREPVHFWAKLTKLLNDPAANPPAEARAVLLRDLPVVDITPAYRFRHRAGMGSLGKPRYVALLEWAGGWICRETKIIVPGATVWASSEKNSGKSKMAEAVKRALRSPDPFYRPEGEWIVRRLAPRCSHIELDHLAQADAGRVLAAMGAETANVHAGTAGVTAEIARDLDRKPAEWLEDAARVMSDVTEQDWKAWRKAK